MKKLLLTWIGAALVVLLLTCFAQKEKLLAGESGGTVPPPAAFTIHASSTSVVAGNPITFSLRFTHEPAFQLTNSVWITNELMPGLDFQLGSEQATVNPSPVVSANRLVWQGDVPPNNRVIITYTALASPTIVATQTLTNAALWRGKELGATENYVELTATLTVTVRPQVRIFTPLVLNKWPPLPGSFSPLNNWDFEAGRTGEWQELVDNEPGKIIFSVAEQPLVGTTGYFAWLGGAPNQTNEIRQMYQFPADHYSLGLYFDYWLYSDERQCSDDDYVEVRIGDDLVLPRIQLCASKNTYQSGEQNGWERSPIVNASPYIGKNVEVRFHSKLDGRDNSNFYLDKVRICTNDPRLTVDRCP